MGSFQGTKVQKYAFSLLATLVLHCPMNFRSEGKFSGLGGVMIFDASFFLCGKKWFSQGENPMKIDAEIQSYI